MGVGNYEQTETTHKAAPQNEENDCGARMIRVILPEKDD